MARQHDLAARRLQVMRDPTTRWQTDSLGRQYVSDGRGGTIINDPSNRSHLEGVIASGKNHSRLFNTFRAAGLAIPAAAVALPAVAGMFGGGGAASAAAGAGSAAAPAATSAVPAVAAGAGKFTLGNLLKFAELGVPAVTSLIGQRSQNRALDRQAALEQQALAEQMAFAREQEAFRRAENERMTAEDQRRWETEERNRQRELAATEEERAYTRRLMDERETRRAPYRQASQDALFRLQDILGIGRR